MKNRSIAKLTIALIIACMLMISGVIIYNTVDASKGFSDSMELQKETSINVDDIQNIHLKVRRENVDILQSSDEQIHIKHYSRKKLKERELFSTSINESTLEIHSQDKNDFILNLDFFTYQSNEALVEVFLPRKEFQSFELDQASGHTKFATLTAHHIDFDLGSGSIFGDRIESETMALQTSSGKIEVNTLHGDGSVKVSSGKNQFNEVVGAVDFKITSGNIKVAEFEGYSNIKLSSGKLIMDKAIFTNDSAIKLTSGSVTIDIDKETAYCYNTSSTSGKITTPSSNCSENNAVNIDIHTTSGKATIE